MAPHWVSLSFQSLLGAFGCRGLRGGLFVRLFWFFYDFRNCRFSHLECANLIPHILNFSSKVCNIDCLTLYPPWAVVCRPLGCHHPGVLFHLYGLRGTRTKVAAQKHVTAQRNEFLPA